jgi:hypothetical protein
MLAGDSGAYIMRGFAISAVLLLVGCAAPNTLTTTSETITTVTTVPANNCPPPGTSVPFVKVMSPTFAPNYYNCNITTTAEFMSNTGIPLPSSLDATHFSFIVRGSGDAAGGNYIAAPKQLADFVFALKRGSKLLMRGGIYADAQQGVTTSTQIPIFVATSVERQK